MITIITFWEWENYIEAKRSVNIRSWEEGGGLDK